MCQSSIVSGDSPFFVLSSFGFRPMRMYTFVLSASSSTSYSLPMNEIFFTSPILTPRKLTSLPTLRPVTTSSEYVSASISPPPVLIPPK